MREFSKSMATGNSTQWWGKRACDEAHPEVKLEASSPTGGDSPGMWSQGGEHRRARRERQSCRLLAGALALGLTMAAGSPLFAAVKTLMYCTAREPDNAPVHFRFENGGAQPEIIIDLDYARPGSGGKWVRGESYLLTIDDNFESAAPPTVTMFTGRAQCTTESSNTFSLTAADRTLTLAAHLNWELDPAPVSRPWTLTRGYSLQIAEHPKGQAQDPRVAPATP